MGNKQAKPRDRPEGNEEEGETKYTFLERLERQRRKLIPPKSRNQKKDLIKDLEKTGTIEEKLIAGEILELFDKLEMVEAKLIDLPNLKDPRNHELFQTKTDQELVSIGSQRDQQLLIKTNFEQLIDTKVSYLLDVSPSDGNLDAKEEGNAPTRAANSLSKLPKKEKALIQQTATQSIQKAISEVQDSHSKTLNLSGCFVTASHLPALEEYFINTETSVQEVNLSQNTIGNEGLRSLTSILKKSLQPITTLKLQNNGLTGLSEERISSLIHDTPVEILDLTRNDLQSAGALDLSQHLGENSALRQLSVRSNYIGRPDVRGIRAFTKALAMNSGLTDVNLRSNALSDFGAYLVGQALARNKHLRRLNLDRNNITDDGLVGFTEGFQFNSKLLVLQLHYNSIGDIGITSLAQALTRRTCHLIALDLFKNCIADHGAEALGRMLNHNAALKTLNLSTNRIGSSGAQALAKGLQENGTLTSLNLGVNQIGARGMEFFSVALKRNSTLTSFNVKCNQIEHLGAIALASALCENTGIKALHIAQNYIGPVGASAIAEALKFNTTLESLIIGNEHNGNHIGPLGGLAFAKHLEMNSRLQHLYFFNTGIGQKAALKIREALKIDHMNSTKPRLLALKKQASRGRSIQQLASVKMTASFDGYESDQNVGNEIDTTSVIDAMRLRLDTDEEDEDEQEISKVLEMKGIEKATIQCFKIFDLYQNEDLQQQEEDNSQREQESDEESHEDDYDEDEDDDEEEELKEREVEEEKQDIPIVDLDDLPQTSQEIQPDKAPLEHAEDDKTVLAKDEEEISEKAEANPHPFDEQLSPEGKQGTEDIKFTRTSPAEKEVMEFGLNGISDGAEEVLLTPAQEINHQNEVNGFGSNDIADGVKVVQLIPVQGVKDHKEITELGPNGILDREEEAQVIPVQDEKDPICQEESQSNDVKETSDKDMTKSQDPNETLVQEAENLTLEMKESKDFDHLRKIQGPSPDLVTEILPNKEDLHESDVSHNTNPKSPTPPDLSAKPKRRKLKKQTPVASSPESPKENSIQSPTPTRAGLKKGSGKA